MDDRTACKRSTNVWKTGLSQCLGIQFCRFWCFVACFVKASVLVSIMLLMSILLTVHCMCLGWRVKLLQCRGPLKIAKNLIRGTILNVAYCCFGELFVLVVNFSLQAFREVIRGLCFNVCLTLLKKLKLKSYCS